MGTRQVNDVHAKITDEIVQAIEAGASEFEMPWHGCSRGGFPRNPATGNMYSGINTLTLWVAGQSNGFASSRWASYLQWKKLGAQVRKGEKGSLVVFYKRLDGEEDKPLNLENEDQPEKIRMVARYSQVFNSDQVDGWEDNTSRLEDNHVTLNSVEAFIDGLGSDIHYGSNSAYYKPALDRIFMPNITKFRDTKFGCAEENFYMVLLHEHIHWTGHKSRLNRNLSERFGTEAYAMEELVAELGSAYLCASLGINTQPRPDHASYISSWLKALKGDKKAIFAMSSLASKASQFLEEKFDAQQS